MTALGSIQWLDELDDERRRRFRQAVGASVVLHVVCVGALAFSPAAPPLAFPQAITVDLVAAVPVAPAAPPAPDPAPKAVPPPLPPKPKVKLLPKEAPTPVARPKPKPEPKPVERRPERPKELSYEDALARLRDDVGEAAPVVPEPKAVAKAEAPSVPAKSGPGILVSPEVAAWNLAVMRHIRSKWITPPEFREPGLATQLVIDVAADGRVVGEPKVERSSGLPQFDDNAVRAVKKASPLPPAPKAGRRTLIFTSEE